MRIASKLGASDWQAEQGINMGISTRELRILHAKCCFVDQQFYWLPMVCLSVLDGIHEQVNRTAFIGPANLIATIDVLAEC